MEKASNKGLFQAGDGELPIQRCPLGVGGQSDRDIEQYFLAPHPDFLFRKVILHTDGACTGNPGPGGWGVIVEYPDGKHPEYELCGGEIDTTNNRMELIAAIRGLDFLQEPSHVLLVTDSQYLMLGITEWLPKWLANNWRNSTKKQVKNRDLWEALLNAARWHKVDWQWVRGHSGHIGNERADVLARRGIDKILKKNRKATQDTKAKYRPQVGARSRGKQSTAFFKKG